MFSSKRGGVHKDLMLILRGHFACMAVYTLLFGYVAKHEWEPLL
ncbi:hypothetical protein HMPREF0183_1870 [Brevibacterium mcbrellneri ATCC 49030]|uniref:Uncharacterized protein n=1 Tax=Brevibacterium mcbrellneri ATCC 49030 TaxID=585530 RepID=D4YPL0_9MICO|nr:hypothetical protein HMPREF0183_1870 [Brevibacterium mcbrellneri ATCC 49030]